MTLRDDFRQVRGSAGITQEDLEKRAAVSRRSIIKLESGAGVTLVTAELVAAGLGCELMLVPSELADQVRDFLASGGKLVGRTPGDVAPRSALDILAG